MSTLANKAMQKLLALGFASLILVQNTVAQGGEDLAAKTQNPISSMVSLPFENNFDFGAPNGGAWVMNVQPVIPVTKGKWNFVNRIIVPIADAPGGVQLPGIPTPIGSGRVFGLGDTNYSLFFSPVDAEGVIWGVGPSFTFPTATDFRLGSRKWSVGPTAVVLTQPKPWSLGVLARQQWSIAGQSERPDVNQFVLQPFVNYNLEGGWYLYSDPAIIANWDNKRSQRWTVPLGIGVGRIMKIGEQPMNFRGGAFYNVERPDSAPDWVAKFTVQFLFPK